METVRFRLTGVSPLLMHSDRGANPLDEDVKAHKELTSKRKKTDEDHEAIMLSEWRLAMYYDDHIGPYLPSFNIRSSLVNGGKFNKLGANIKRATLMPDHAVPLEYKGPRDLDQLAADSSFRDVRSVVVARSRLMRTRPIFNEWACEFDLMFDQNQIEQGQLTHAFQNAGKLVGLGDFRPECGGPFGRYSVAVM
jgi:hypothetical protein